jgi:hypothetical protein
MNFNHIMSHGKIPLEQIMRFGIFPLINVMTIYDEDSIYIFKIISQKDYCVTKWQLVDRLYVSCKNGTSCKLHMDNQ